MAKRGIDMLPLLDVFMVVLFVFATIQEGQLDVSTQQLEAAQDQLVAAQIESATQAIQLASNTAALELREQELREANAREQALREQVGAYQRECGPHVGDGPLCPAASPEARELVKVAQVHAQLLANVAMFEIEIGGELRPDGIVNHCCFRANPPEGPWQACGSVPPGAAERGDWFDQGGAGLREALRETRDGYAIVLIQQDGEASYQISQDLANLLHDRLREHYVYDTGLGSGPLDCSLGFPLPP
jgi:biopolymer transport protein ExbD